MHRSVQNVQSFTILREDMGTVFRICHQMEDFEEIGSDYVAGDAASSSTADYSAAPIPDDGGFHQACHARFTDSQRIERAMKSMKRKTDAAASTGKLVLVIVHVLMQG